MLKKQVTIQKGFTLLNNNNIILFYQFNNISIKNWHFLKNELRKLEDINTLIIQNKIAKNIIEKLQNSKDSFLPLSTVSLKKPSFIGDLKIEKKKFHKRDCKLNNLFQGPTFLAGCNTNIELIAIYDLLKNYPNFIFVGGLYNNQNISHYTLEKLVNLNDSIKSELIQFLELKTSSICFIESHLVHKILNIVEILKRSCTK